jgi:hypothetical protein
MVLGVCEYILRHPSMRRIPAKSEKLFSRLVPAAVKVRRHQKHHGNAKGGTACRRREEINGCLQ